MHRSPLALVVAAFLTFPLAAGVIDTVAGTGKPGHTGDGGKATEATLDQPFHCELFGKDTLYIAEAGSHCVRKLDLKTGTLTTVAGTGKKGYTGDGGKAVEATFNEPYAVVADADGNLYVADRLNAVIRKVDGKTGIVTTVAGNGKKAFAGDGGKATEASLVEPNDVCLDGKGGLLIADVGDWRIRRVDLKAGTISTFAGVGKVRVPESGKGDGGPAAKAIIQGARAVCADSKGNVYVCEREGNSVRKITAEGVISTVAGTGAKGTKDGEGKEATFNGPKAIRCDTEGNVFVVDTENHSVRKIEAKSGKVTTIAGGQKGSGGDGGDPRKAGLDRPHGCVVGADGVLYIADTNNHRVRRIQ